MSDNSVLQQKLRNAGQQAEGTSDLLLQAAEEIRTLRQQLAAEEKRTVKLREALILVRDSVNETITKALNP